MKLFFFHTRNFCKNSKGTSNFVLYILQIPIIIPVAVTLASILLVLAPVISAPELAYLYCVLFIGSGLIVYVLFVNFKFNWPQKISSKYNSHSQLQVQNSTAKLLINCCNEAYYIGHPIWIMSGVWKGGCILLLPVKKSGLTSRKMKLYLQKRNTYLQ